MGIKVHIVYNFHNGAWGGGNQFLKALRKELINLNSYTDSPSEADVFIFNSHQEGRRISECASRGKPMIHRLDGLPKLYNTPQDTRQDTIFRLNSLYATANIYQSEWSKEKHLMFGLKDKISTVIHNAADPELFYPKKEENVGKFKLITTSWSTNKNKGFNFLKLLDKHFDSEQYECTFVGNSPVRFNRIKQLEAKPSNELADILRSHDIFVTASKNDTCSNSLIEALTCGLPALVLDSGANRELIGKAGLIFTSIDGLLTGLQVVSTNLSWFKSNINVPHINDVANKYINFAEKICS